MANKKTPGDEKPVGSRQAPPSEGPAFKSSHDIVASLPSNRNPNERQRLLLQTWRALAHQTVSAKLAYAKKHHNSFILPILDSPYTSMFKVIGQLAKTPNAFEQVS